MKKSVLFFGILIVLCVWHSVASAAVYVPVEMKISQPGVSHRYVSFDFIVPDRECGNISFYRFKRTTYTQKTPAGWVQQQSGEKARRGWYRIINEPGRNCPGEAVMIRSEIDRIALQGSLSMSEVEPQDLNLFRSIEWVPQNSLFLSEDDARYSYYLLNPLYEKSMKLDSPEFYNLIDNTTGTLVGVIIGDDKGSISKTVRVILDDNLTSLLRGEMIAQSSVIVLIFQEHEIK